MLMRVLIAGRSSAAVAGLKAYLHDVPGLDIRAHVITNGHTDPLHGVDFVPELVILHFEAGKRAELAAWATRPVEGRPTLIVVGPGGDGEATRLAIRSGARDFLPEPIAKADLISTVQQVRTEMLTQAQRTRGSVHAFVSAAGGAGGSFLAANVAHVLAAHARRTVALLDLDLNFAPTAHHLNLGAERGLLEAFEQVGTLDGDALRGFGATHASGLRLFCSTSKHAVLSKDIPSDRLSSLVNLLTAHFQDLVIDVPHIVDNLTATAFGMATNVYLVVQQSTLHVRNATRIARILREELSVPPDRVKLLVNRYNKNALLQAGEIGEALNIEAFDTIPNHYQRAQESSDSGVPLYESDRNTAISTAIVDFVSEMIGAKTERPSLLRRALPAFLRPN